MISKKVDEVRYAGIVIEEEKLALFALDGLDASYDAFVIAIMATKGEISFSKFKGLLKGHEARMIRDSSRRQPPSANLAHTSYQPPKTPVATTLVVESL